MEDSALYGSTNHSVLILMLLAASERVACLSAVSGHKKASYISSISLEFCLAALAILFTVKGSETISDLTRDYLRALAILETFAIQSFSHPGFSC